MNFTNIELDFESSIPLFFQLKRIISDRISKNELKPGEKLPTEKEFSEILGVSRITIKRAYDEMRNEGLLERVRAKGTFINSEVQIDRISDSYEAIQISESISANGYKASVKTLEIMDVVPPREIVTLLDLTEKGKVTKVKRIYFADDCPIALSCYYLNQNIKFTCSPKDLDTTSLYRYLYNNYRVKLKSGLRKTTAIVANKEVSELLKVNTGSPLLKLIGRDHDKSGTNIGAMSTLYNASIVEIEFSFDQSKSLRWLNTKVSDVNYRC